MNVARAIETGGRGRGRLGGVALAAYAALVFVFLYLPIVVIILFAFDDKPVPGLPIKGLTLNWFERAFSTPDLMDGLFTSICLALCSALLATAIAMPAAMALAWRDIKLRTLVVCLVLAPIVAPQIVIGLGLVLLFRFTPGLIGSPAIVIAHATLTACYATMILYSRLLGFPRSYLEAAMDLGASDARVFFEIVLPLAAPAVLAVLLLAFTDAFGEYVVAWFVAGFTKTLPIVIWGSMRGVLSPAINAVSAIIILVSLVLSAASQMWIIRQARSSAP
jgi:ABC-type spermidine/putrescine transport system permease subunit II